MTAHTLAWIYFGLCCLCAAGAVLWWMARQAKRERLELTHGHCVRPTTTEERRATFRIQPARPFSEPAAKGFGRDGVIGIDQISRAERQRLLKH